MIPELPSDPAALDPLGADSLPLGADDLDEDRDFGLSEAEATRRRGLGWLLLSGLVLGLGLGGWWGYGAWQRRSAMPVVVTTAAVERSDLETRVDASGTVALGGQQTLKAPSDVTVEAVLVEAGQTVAAGQVLLRLRDRTLQSELDEALIQKQIKQLQLTRQQELRQERQRDVARAQERLTESQALLAEGYISEDSFEDDRTALEDAQSALRGAEVDLQTAKLEFDQTLARIANLQAQLADNQIEAPFAAVVLNMAVGPGDGVPRESPLLTLGDPTKETIQFQMVALDAAKVKPGMPVRVFAIGPDPIKYAGQVVTIAPQAINETEGNSGQSLVQAQARLDRPSGVLIPGSTVSVEVITNRRPQALAVPLTTLQTGADGPYVWVRDDQGKARQRPVVVGLETLEAVEIITGLQAGDQLIVELPPDQPLQEGMTVLTPDGNAAGAGPAPDPNGPDN